MTVAEAVFERVRALPEPAQSEVLDFVRFLQAKSGQVAATREDATWAAFSVEQAMRGMENEATTYAIEDLKEVF